MDDLDNLLSDLHSTTVELKRKSESQKNGSTKDHPSADPLPCQSEFVNCSPDVECIQSLSTMERMLDGYASYREGQVEERPRVDNLLGELNVSIPNSERTRSAAMAAKDLDCLMASLSDFKVSPHVNNVETKTLYEGTVSQGKMLNNNEGFSSVTGTLPSKTSSLGISTIPKGDCGQCQKPIIGQVLIALGNMWHPEHFLCVHCNQELGHRSFFERGGNAYCESDYHNLFAPRCAYCNGPIKDRCVTALDKTWHPEHFFCAKCGKEFGDEGFHEKDGRPFCRKDYFAFFAPKCCGCDKAITKNYITALNLQWHPECFVCQDCKQSFAGGSFFEHLGQPYCEIHYHEKRGSLCNGCHKPISGRCVTAMGGKYHPEHFVCSFCLKHLTKGTFKEHENKAYCHSCFGVLLN